MLQVFFTGGLGIYPKPILLMSKLSQNGVVLVKSWNTCDTKFKIRNIKYLNYFTLLVTQSSPV